MKPENLKSHLVPHFDLFGTGQGWQPTRLVGLACDGPNLVLGEIFHWGGGENTEAIKNSLSPISVFYL